MDGKYKYENLIQRSFVENYVDIPEEAKEELSTVYAEAENCVVTTQVLNHIMNTVEKGVDEPSDKVLIKIKTVLDDYNAYLRMVKLTNSNMEE